jgi:hypothetical protein
MATQQERLQRMIQEMAAQLVPLVPPSSTGTSIVPGARHGAPPPPPCPGLNRVHHSRYKWVVPFGSSADKETYCEKCASKLGIMGTPYRSEGGTNCDGFLKSNKSDNGVFNVSFWNPDLNMYYPTSAADESGIYYVSMPSGTRFSTLLHSSNPQKQVFRYTVSVHRTGMDEEEVVAMEGKHYHTESCFLSKGQTKLAMGYVDSSNEGWSVISADTAEKYNLIRPGDTVTISFHIYDINDHDCTLDSNHHLGSYKLTRNNIVVPKTTSGLKGVQQQYDGKLTSVLPSQKFDKFTKVPMVMKFVFITNHNKPDTSDLLLASVLSKMASITTSTLAKATVAARRAITEETAVIARRVLCETEVTILAKKLQDIKKYLPSVSNEPEPEPSQPVVSDANPDIDSATDTEATEATEASRTLPESDVGSDTDSDSDYDISITNNITNGITNITNGIDIDSDTDSDILD